MPDDEQQPAAGARWELTITADAEVIKAEPAAPPAEPAEDQP